MIEIVCPGSLTDSVAELSAIEIEFTMIGVVIVTV